MHQRQLPAGTPVPVKLARDHVVEIQTTRVAGRTVAHPPVHVEVDSLALAQESKGTAAPSTPPRVSRTATLTRSTLALNQYSRS